ncbi:MAG TPA: metallophosphoesterase family protein [Ktedonobacteraceae bacterium]|nr:metallophosphoesterase family protein [Ktedonobacteraceae bacterium]
MKIAALYDIHGNLPALNAVLEELKEVQPDLIVVGGDIVSGPFPEQTLERLFQLGAQVRAIRGNGDREVVLAFDGQPIKRHYLPDASEKALEEIHWVAKQLTRSQRDFLAALPEQLELQVEGLGRILFCHATPRNDEEIFTPITPDERLGTLFSAVTQESVVCGHTHIQFERHIGDLHILNAGSVGMPYADQPGAYWLLLSPQGYEFRRTAYDVERAAQVIRASGNPHAQAFAEENVLQVPTAAEATEHFERLLQER